MRLLQQALPPETEHNHNVLAITLGVVLGFVAIKVGA